VALLEGQELGTHCRLDRLGHRFAQPLGIPIRLDSSERGVGPEGSSRRILIDLAEQKTCPGVLQAQSRIHCIPNKSTHRMSGHNVNLKYQRRQMLLTGRLVVRHVDVP
jgi:hypothetical protein